MMFEIEVKEKYDENDYPHIKFSETFNTLDSSKITTFMRCERRFLWEYILGLRSEFPNKHLVYGTALHLALEYLLKLKPFVVNDPDLIRLEIEKAYMLALDYYREYFSVDADEFNKPKSPDYIIPSLFKYVETYKKEWETEELIATEIYGKVPIDNKGTMVTYRQDAIMRNRNGQIYTLEHKTGSQAGSAWYDKWSLSIQPLVYVHALHVIYPGEDIWGLLINAIIAAKRKVVSLDGIHLHRVPVRFTKGLLARGLENLTSWTSSINRNMEELQRATPDDVSLKSFKLCPESCTDFNSTCIYHSLCMTEANPIRLASRIKDDYKNIPEGFKIEHWNPLAEANTEVI